MYVSVCIVGSKPKRITRERKTKSLRDGQEKESGNDAGRDRLRKKAKKM